MLKLSMAKFMQTIIRTIILTSTTLVTAGLIVLACTTISFASGIIDEFNYVKYAESEDGNFHVFLSDNTIATYTLSSASNAWNYNTGTVDSLIAGTYISSIADKNTSAKYPPTYNAIHLAYNGYSWEIYIPYFKTYSGAHRWLFFDNSLLISSSNSKPSGFPNIDLGLSRTDVEQMIDNALNNTTSASTTAKNIQSNVTNAYSSYAEGNINLSELQTTIASLQDQLNNLNNLSSTTIADKIAITNATLQVQLVQDAANKDSIIEELQTDLKVSSNIQSQITGKINEANQTFKNYSQGSVTQTEAVTQINQYITYLTSQITPETPTADIEAINTAINTVNGIKDSIINHSELDKDVSEEQVRSDEEEIEMLNEMISVMQDQDIENKLQDQEITGNASDINTILDPVWNNEYFNYLIGCAGVLIIACIVLHVRYRFL